MTYFNKPFFIMVMFLLFHLSNAYSSPSKKAFIIGSRKDFGREIDPLAKVLPQKGYEVSQWLDLPKEALDETSKKLKLEMQKASPGDQILISLQCHGEEKHDKAGNTTNHLCCLNESCNHVLWTSDLIPIAKEAARKGVKFVVMDNSCGGGGTVKLLEGIKGVCAMANTTNRLPSLTGAPAYSEYLKDPTITNFESLGERGNLEILKNLAGRPYQRVYTSGCYSKFMDFRNKYMWALGSTGPGTFKKTKLKSILYGGDNFPTEKQLSVDGEIVAACEKASELNLELETLLGSLNKYNDDQRWEQSFQKVYPQIIHDYAKHGVKLSNLFTYSTKKVANEIKGRIKKLLDLHKEHVNLIGQLNIAVEATTSDKKQELIKSANIMALKIKIFAIQNKVVQERPKISSLLNILETTECKMEGETAPSPCSQIKI